MLLDDRRLLITIADVSGKGAGAALLTANLQAILKFVDLDERPLDQIAASINTHLCRHTEPDRFVTMMMGVLDLQSRRLTYVNAGHNPAMLRRGIGGRAARRDVTTRWAQSRGWYSLLPKPSWRPAMRSCSTPTALGTPQPRQRVLRREQHRGHARVERP